MGDQSPVPGQRLSDSGYSSASERTSTRRGRAPTAAERSHLRRSATGGGIIQSIVVRIFTPSARAVTAVLPVVCTKVISMSIDLSDLHKLPVSEKLRIVEALWDDIGASDEPVVLQPWQRDEGKRRSDELKADPSIAIDRAELWRRVNG